ncbi:hypothetical protein LIER_22897 [Lithospermum erythrorhizon]|uniref:RNase H type-1 domain-containing protein n=1 Tax=Lithospermum erythrorhizon TaxID=34254 RepID=A0AAV3QWR1_LITER
MMQSKYWKGDSLIATLLQVNVQTSVSTRPKLLSWEKPLPTQLKQHGVSGSPLEAELEALLLCLQVCKHKGLYGVQVEVDSLMIVQMTTKKTSHWTLQNKCYSFSQV